MNEAYTRGQKVLHWLLAVLLLFWLFVSGELVEEAQGDDKGFILMFHSGGAIVIGMLMAFRFYLRRKHPVVVMGSLKDWEKVWSQRIHVAFYVFVALMVLSGIVQGMFFEQDVRVFGLINITLGHNESLMGIFHLVHGASANVLKVLILLHILAALKHQFIDKQAMLKRMA
ncbi:MAG: cytochrome b/b6 domain-containing protein [Proteobacteria bacterium]|nr:cytochrome b/b6 domain-containing protein [Pseudomonadota bacterium]MDA0927141.1 cytochrome b/b6 domain-containing protein [Pseudomonadota bacterium]